MSHTSPIDIESLRETACVTAGYLDACDQGAREVRLDPRYYQACGKLLNSIFTAVDAEKAFPILLEQSAAAREVAEAIKIGHRIEVSRLGYYPELCVSLNRAAT